MIWCLLFREGGWREEGKCFFLRSKNVVLYAHFTFVIKYVSVIIIKEGVAAGRRVMMKEEEEEEVDHDMVRGRLGRACCSIEEEEDGETSRLCCMCGVYTSTLNFVLRFGRVLKEMQLFYYYYLPGCLFTVRLCITHAQALNLCTRDN